MVPRIPICRPPYILLINWKRRFWFINRENIFSSKIAFPPVKCPFITIQKPANITAMWTKCRRRNRDFFVEQKILRFDWEAIFTILANSSFKHFLLSRDEYD